MPRGCRGAAEAIYRRVRGAVMDVACPRINPVELNNRAFRPCPKQPYQLKLFHRLVGQVLWKVSEVFRTSLQR